MSTATRRHDRPTTSHVDLLVVGAGPAGLYAAYCAGFRGLRTAVVDALPEIGGQVVGMYPEKAILDIAGYPAVRGRDLINALVLQAETFGPEFWLDEEVQGLTSTPGAGEVVLTTSAGRTVHAGAVVLAGGIGTFTPRPFTPGLDWLGRGVSYFVPDLTVHDDKDVVIVGGGDSAFDWALHLEPIARSVTMVHRRDRFRAHKGSVDRVRDSNVRMLVNAEVTEVRGDGWVSGAEVRVAGQDRAVSLAAQSIVAALGFTADLGAMNDWGLGLVNRRIPVNTRMETAIPRVYAAGDITDYPGKVRLISVGFGEAATAVNNAAVLLDPGLDLFPGHSTEGD
ncbi:NAD(P)/FAD-dependent oxidoreductase [Raineyella sp.]|uniref:NAD(P)/FAD-dependent oxidoreductase n=1 Tax=Raineyella sp. TaxID=1911550 RepID=UPI002B1FF42D|nr:NAD(P)/FAD-dependent oxidoreductase [Raineyella sp.]MEA5155310.1 NAD(P)/FAD-dependent oxidoreductase [Raineyella sp.]